MCGAYCLIGSFKLRRKGRGWQYNFWRSILCHVLEFLYSWLASYPSLYLGPQALMTELLSNRKEVPRLSVNDKDDAWAQV